MIWGGTQDFQGHPYKGACWNKLAHLLAVLGAGTKQGLPCDMSRGTAGPAAARPWRAAYELLGAEEHDNGGQMTAK